MLTNNEDFLNLFNFTNNYLILYLLIVAILIIVIYFLNIYTY